MSSLQTKLPYFSYSKKERIREIKITFSISKNLKLQLYWTNFKVVQKNEITQNKFKVKILHLLLWVLLPVMTLIRGTLMKKRKKSTVREDNSKGIKKKSQLWNL